MSCDRNTARNTLSAMNIWAKDAARLEPGGLASAEQRLAATIVSKRMQWRDEQSKFMEGVTDFGLVAMQPVLCPHRSSDVGRVGRNVVRMVLVANPLGHVIGFDQEGLLRDDNLSPEDQHRLAGIIILPPEIRDALEDERITVVGHGMINRWTQDLAKSGMHIIRRLVDTQEAYPAAYSLPNIQCKSKWQARLYGLKEGAVTVSAVAKRLRSLSAGKFEVDRHAQQALGTLVFSVTFPLVVVSEIAMRRLRNRPNMLEQRHVARDGLAGVMLAEFAVDVTKAEGIRRGIYDSLAVSKMKFGCHLADLERVEEGPGVEYSCNEHLVSACPRLHARCGHCSFRGHFTPPTTVARVGPVDDRRLKLCRDTEPAVMEGLGAAFEEKN